MTTSHQITSYLFHRREFYVHLFAATVAALLVALSPANAQPPEFSGTVRHVTDGDTFRMHDLEPAIRVWGLDAPERNERGGSAATATMRQLISGQILTCRIRDVDRYGRIVGQCFLPDGRDIAGAMIDAGVAFEYCRYSGGFYGTCLGQ